ncbi:MAG: F0F1 ATP synthase subunit alpha [Planctomycetes bacterium]|nr:F0F1 ATP synthase subunit alpha [Planctomycetota bacterium]
MELRPSDVTSLLREQILKYGEKLHTESVGTVLQVGDGVARVAGLDQCMMSELLEFPGGVMGVALNLEEDNVGCVLLGSESEVREGDVVKTTGRIISVPVGPEIIGRVVDSLGRPKDGRGPIDTKGRFGPIEGQSPNVVERQPVKEPLQTGIKAIDSMIPIGRGQRELIIGDRQTGKTAICIDTFINQKSTGGGDPKNPEQVICIYVAVGQKQSTVVDVTRRLEAEGALAYTIVVDASASENAAMQYLAPYAGAAMGEYLRDEGRHVLIIYDDLYKQAMAYRQVMLLLRRPPGREAFPGDIFNLHSRLLERAAKLSKAKGGGSMTALPIVETQEGDVSAYIPTNVISITDGQIFLEGELFHQGVRPAVNAGISVSRVGGSAQIPAMKKVAGGLRIQLAQFRELAAFAQFGSDLDEATRRQLAQGERLVEILKQSQYAPVPVEEQVAVIFAATRERSTPEGKREFLLHKIPTAKIRAFEAAFLGYLRERQPALLESIRTGKKMTEEIEKGLEAAALECREEFLASIDDGSAAKVAKPAAAKAEAKPAAKPAKAH